MKKCGTLLVFMMVIGVYVGRAQPMVNRLSMDFQDLPLEQILDSITYKTGYFFSYNSDALPKGSLYTLRRYDVRVDSLLNALLVGTGLEYLMDDNQIIVRKIPEDYTLEVIDGGKKKSEIRGWVREESSNEPIVGANVFINGSTIGGVTDVNGNYQIKNVPPGTHQLVISYVGFETNSYQLKVYNGDTYILNSFISQRPQELQPVEIISQPLVDSSDWSHYYRIFYKEFIGFSYNANQCEIINPEVIGFTYDKQNDLLKAYADQTILVENKALGYRLQCQLASFEKEGSRTQFHTRVLFENMEYSSNRLRKRWKRNREDTYEGSSAHFFSSLIEGKHKREGFLCYLMSEAGNTEVDEEELIKKDSVGYNWVLDFDSTLIVRYTKELESRLYLSYIDETIDGVINQPHSPTREPGHQISMLDLQEDHVILLTNGQVQNPENVRRLGYWSWERVADLMPVDYDPKNDL